MDSDTIDRMALAFFMRFCLVEVGSYLPPIFHIVGGGNVSLGLQLSNAEG